MSGSLGFLRLVDGEDDDGAVVADDVANVDVAAGLFHLVGEDGEDFTFVGEFGGDELVACVERFLLGRLVGIGGAGLFFIWAAIGLRYHPASRLRWRASNDLHDN